MLIAFTTPTVPATSNPMTANPSTVLALEWRSAVSPRSCICVCVVIKCLVRSCPLATAESCPVPRLRGSLLQPAFGSGSLTAFLGFNSGAPRCQPVISGRPALGLIRVTMAKPGPTAACSRDLYSFASKSKNDQINQPKPKATENRHQPKSGGAAKTYKSNHQTNQTCKECCWPM